MKNESRVNLLVLIVALLLGSVVSFAQTTTIPATVATTGKTPIIIIPGLTGSNLVNSRTGEEVWFKARRSKDDDIRLPISPNPLQNRDNLTAKDIIRKVEFLKFCRRSKFMERLIRRSANASAAIEKQIGMPPTRKDSQDTFYVFPYDWRRDNVENARLLMRKIDTLKRRLGKPNLKFNIVAHSMGGLIARYAAMYGSAESSGAAPAADMGRGQKF